MKKQIVFVSHNQSFSLPIVKTEKIIQWELPVPVPETETYVLGMIQYDQKVLPIVDLRQRLYQQNTVTNEQSKIIIVQWQESLIGLLVEGITGIQDFTLEEIEEPQTELEQEKAYLKYFIKTKEDIIIQLAIDELFNGQGLLDILAEDQMYETFLPELSEQVEADAQ